VQFYRHSGRGGTWGVPLATASGIVAALVLAFAYVYVINWIPFIYVAFLATAAFGFGVGAATAWGAKTGKMRNMMTATLVGGLAGLFALYFAWAFDPMVRFRQQFAAPFWDVELIWQYMKAGYADGFWSIGGNGGAVTGLFLAAVWIAEAALIVGISALAVKFLLGEQPFCEETNQWTKSEKGVARLSLVNDEQVEAKLQQLLAGDVSSLKTFYRADKSADHLQLDVAVCDDCPTCNFLTVKAVRHVTNRKGEVTKQETKLLVNLQVTKEELATIRSAGIDWPMESLEDNGGLAESQLDGKS
jgi:hypothetical protein